MNVSMLEALELCDISVGRVPGHIHCPFHDEDTASCAIWEDHWHCFGCTKGGSPLAFIAYYVAEGEEPERTHYSLAAKLVNRTYDMEDRPERVMRERELADLTDRFGAEAARSHVEFFDAADEFVTGRWPHLALDWLRSTFGVLPTRYALWIPHVDDEGVVRGIKTRSYATGNKLAVEGSCFTSRLYRGKLAGGRMAVLTEGESDTWTMTRHFESMQGIDVLGLPSGAKTWKQNFEDELASKYARVDLWLDADRTGREAAIAVLNRLQGRGLATYDRVVPVDYGDVTEAYVDGWRPIP